ncbi:MAG TPA: hypothetical protein EYH22_02600 [Candidatus Nanopusillus sp.]|nr:hypothetical protein [Candidatus Nanopusillus sp.]
MDKQKLLATLLLLGVASVYSVDAPYTTVPVPIDNVIHLDNSSDYAVYKVILVNPTNETYYYYFQEVSISWTFIYNRGVHLISPGKSITEYIKIRPAKETSEIPILLVIFEKDDKKVSYPLYFSPLIISNQKQIFENLTGDELGYDVRIDKTNLKPGDHINLYISVRNPSKDKRNITINISSDILVENINNSIELKEGQTLITAPIKISKTIQPGNYSITINIGNLSRTVNVTVGRPINVSISERNDIIYITNLNDYENEYTLKKEITFTEKLLYKYDPKPDYEITENGKHYYVWKLVLKPGETYTVRKSINWFNILIFILLIVLPTIYLFLSYLSPKLSIRKDILKIDSKNREIKIMITLKNSSIYKIRNIKVIETLLQIFEPTDKYEFVKPIGSYTKGGKIYIKWLIDELLPGEERLIVYTIKYRSEVVGELELDPAIAEFTVFNNKYIVKSNKLILRFV